MAVRQISFATMFVPPHGHQRRVCAVHAVVSGEVGPVAGPELTVFEIGDRGEHVGHRYNVLAAATVSSHLEHKRAYNLWMAPLEVRV